MSLWDIVAGISTSKQLDPNNDKETKTFWKKLNSASVDLINGDGLSFTNEGGYTWNIFGANVNFVCDLEALIEGAIATKWHGHLAEGVLGGLFFGPGANNNIVIGNSLTLNYMVGHSNNFTVMRGNPEFSISYSPWQDGALGQDGSPITGKNARNRHKLMWLAIAGFALLVAASDIALNVLKNKLNGEEEVVHEDEAEIEKYKALVEAEQQEAQAHGQVVNPDAGGTPAEPTHAQEELEHAEHQYHTDEGTLKGTETTYEWIVFASILLENRGIWLLKFLEELCAGVKTVRTELKDITNTITKVWNDASGSNDKPALQEAVINLENTIAQLEQLILIPGVAEDVTQGFEAQLVLAKNYCGVLKIKLKNYKDALAIIDEILDENDEE